MTELHREPIAQSKLHWYRVPLDRAVLAELNRRSDAWGFAQTLGHLGIIMATGALAKQAGEKPGCRCAQRARLAAPPGDGGCCCSRSRM